MPQSIRPVRLNHLNLVLDDFDASVAQFQALFGAEFMLDLPGASWRACLVEFGGVIFEFFCPNNFFFNTRIGPHYIGLEYQADMAKVREVVAARGMGVVRDIGAALHTDPADGFGVAFEFYDGSFHDNDYPLLGGKIKSAAYWRDEHPLGLIGLKAYTVAVSDLAAAATFFQDFLAAEPLYEEGRPTIAARAAGFQVADGQVEIVTPTGDGSLRRHLERVGQGMRSLVFQVRDLEQAKRYFIARGVEPEPGSAEDRFALPVSASRGVVFEFEG